MLTSSVPAAPTMAMLMSPMNAPTDTSSGSAPLETTVPGNTDAPVLMQSMLLRSAAAPSNETAVEPTQAPSSDDPVISPAGVAVNKVTAGPDEPTNTVTEAGASTEMPFISVKQVTMTETAVPAENEAVEMLEVVTVITPEMKATDNAKTLSEALIGTAAMVNHGAEFIADEAMASMNQAVSDGKAGNKYFIRLVDRQI